VGTLINGKVYHLVEVVALRRQEEMMDAMSEEEAAGPPMAGTCACGCGRPTNVGGGKGRPNKTGLSGYCAAMKRYWKKRGRFHLVGA
jgi:hypothetical protein